MLVPVPLQPNNPEVRASTQVNARGFIPSQWMVRTPANAHSLTDWLDQSADWATGVGQSCQTPVHVCLVYLPEGLAYAVIPHSFSTSFSICLLTLTSHPLLLLKVLIPRFAVELLRRTEAAALSFASELRETEGKGRDRREERDTVGRLIHD